MRQKKHYRHSKYGRRFVAGSMWGKTVKWENGLPVCPYHGSSEGVEFDRSEEDAGGDMWKLWNCKHCKRGFETRRPVTSYYEKTGMWLVEGKWS